MKRSLKPTPISRLLVLPGALCLVSASVLVGYASNRFVDNSAQPRLYGDASLKLSWLAIQDKAASQETQGPPDEGRATDPAVDYTTAISLLQKRYYGQTVDRKQVRQLTYEGIRGMLGSLRDQFTSFLDPDEWSQFHATTEGVLEGIGAILQPDGPYIRIARPIETGPAEKAGIKANDVIVRVDHENMKGRDINYVVHRIKGARGTRVTLDILRDSKPLTFRITRALVEPPVVQHWMEDSQAKIGHIILEEFNEKSMEQLEHAYTDLNRQGMKALVLDLRYNPGGLLEVAIQVASAFIHRDANKALNNVAVWIHDGNGREQGRQLVSTEFKYRTVPLVVLVNDNSASASEIVTGAIKDYGVGTIIGERTFGKGKVQTLFPLEDGSALRLTTQLYFPPKHNDINFKRDADGERVAGTGGIVPDIEVPQSANWKQDFKDKANDLQLQRSLAFLRDRLKGLTTAQATQDISLNGVSAKSVKDSELTVQRQSIYGAP